MKITPDGETRVAFEHWHSAGREPAPGIVIPAYVFGPFAAHREIVCLKHDGTPEYRRTGYQITHAPSGKRIGGALTKARALALAAAGSALDAAGDFAAPVPADTARSRETARAMLALLTDDERFAARYAPEVKDGAA